MQKFIMEYLVSGPYETDAKQSPKNINQLDYEINMRKSIPDNPMKKPDNDIVLNGQSALGLPWCYHYDYGNWFVDYSRGYEVLKEVEMQAVTGIVSNVEQTIDITIWSYCAIGLWCNNAFVGGIEKAVYKPMSKQEVSLDLKAGYNEILIKLQTLGVRDTRIVFGLELAKDCEGIHIELSPKYGDFSELRDVKKWLDNLKLNGQYLINDAPAPKDTAIVYDANEHDFSKINQNKEKTDISRSKQVKLCSDNPYVRVICNMDATRLSRRFIQLEAVMPRYENAVSFDENKVKLLRKIGSVESLNRGNKFGFAMSNVLARRAIDNVLDKDESLLYETLNQIERRYDCTDFMIAGLIRYIKNYSVDSKFEARMKTVLTNYRYWMTHTGEDAMCFWSENHALLFYSAAMFCGEMYPEEYFPRAEMTGKQLTEFGEKRVLEWIEDVEEYGFEEFLASIYVSVTFIALLNLIDFAKEEISQRAKKITDYLVAILAKHTFDGSVYGPMGRVYGDVIFPFQQGTQALVHLMNPSAPYDYSEGWMAFYATSSYEFAQKHIELMHNDIMEVYNSGNARIHLNKQQNYVLTSVESPRRDASYIRWENVTLAEKSNQENHEYTKSLNERFHGTTYFEPGVSGYQQHLWYGGLDNSTPVFVSHPGGTTASCTVRPGYWYGNGVFPAIIQVDNMIGSIYCIPSTHPIHFTHVFWPKVRMEQTIYSDGWLFGQKNDGFIALWCSHKMEKHEDQLSECEFRVYSSESAYLCICSDTWQHSSFHEFMDYCKEQTPYYEVKEKRLTSKKIDMIYTSATDLTQYV